MPGRERDRIRHLGEDVCIHAFCLRWGESTTGILHTILGDPTFSTILWLRQFAWCRDDTVGSEINAWDKPPFDLKKWGGWICSSDFISVMPCRLQFQMNFRCAVFLVVTVGSVFAYTLYTCPCDV